MQARFGDTGGALPDYRFKASIAIKQGTRILGFPNVHKNYVSTKCAIALYLKKKKRESVPYLNLKAPVTEKH